MYEIDGEVPTHLETWWKRDQPWCLHSAAWWRQHWERTGIFESIFADTMSDSSVYWRDWVRLIAPENTLELAALEGNAGRTLGYVRVVGRRRSEPLPVEPSISIPCQYSKKRVLREWQ